MLMPNLFSKRIVRVVWMLVDDKSTLEEEDVVMVVMMVKIEVDDRDLCYQYHPFHQYRLDSLYLSVNRNHHYCQLVVGGAA